ncbi:MAG: collagen binding domain-containing protein, partial [Erysipelotrichaceae bacterium]
KHGEYDYDKKQINWSVGVNYNREKISKLIVEDSSPEGLKLIDGSIKVMKLELNAGGKGKEVSEFKNFTVEKITVNGKPGMRIIFNEAISSAYKITYSTVDEDGLIAKEYTNKAVVSGTKKPSTLTAKVPVLHGDEYTEKRAVQEGDLINWTVNYNFAQSKLTDATLVDKPSANTLVLKDSFHVFKAVSNVNKPGEFIKGEGLSTSLYDVKLSDDGSFKLKFKKEINEAYMIQYQSYINDVDGSYIENTAYATSKQISNEKNPSKESIQVVLSSASGSGSGETGAVTLKKVDAFNPEQTLEGTEFTIWILDNEGNKRLPVKTIQTDANGEATFENLLYKDYIIVEDQATEGYKVNVDNEIPVTVDSDSKELVITNDPTNPTGQLIITKVSAKDDSVFLPGAVFKLVDQNGKTVLKDITTGDDGSIEVEVPLTLETDENHKPLSLSNDFVLIETKAPKGYKLSKKEYAVTIKYTETTELTIANKELPTITSPNTEENNNHNNN